MIFGDTSFWVALTNRRDPHHPEATALLAAHAGDRLVTTGEVRGETWTFLRRREADWIARRIGGLAPEEVGETHKSPLSRRHASIRRLGAATWLGGLRPIAVVLRIAGLVKNPICAGGDAFSAAPKPPDAPATGSR